MRTRQTPGAMPAGEPLAGSRLLYLDNLRIGLTILVVLHHVAMAYGAAGPAFYWVELPPGGISRNLLVFVLTNQAWFMGAFFLLAGFFTPDSIERKGAGAFTRSRMLRLGVPLIAYMVILNPIAALGGFFLPDYLYPYTSETYRYIDQVRMGPVWFVAMLLIFSLGYAAWYSTVKGARDVRDRAGRTPGLAAIGAFILGLALAGYLVRLAVPVGETAFGFPSLGYLAQYVSFFVLGAMAYRHDWLTTLRTSTGMVGLAAAAVATVLLFPLAFSGEMLSLELTEVLGKAFGEGHWQSGVYALWDSILSVGLSLGLIVGFRAVRDHQGSLGRFMARQSYAVFIVHIPIVVFLSISLGSIELDHMLKVGIASATAVPLCFGIASLVRRLPGATKVL